MNGEEPEADAISYVTPDRRLSTVIVFGCSSLSHPYVIAYVFSVLVLCGDTFCKRGG